MRLLAKIPTCGLGWYNNISALRVHSFRIYCVRTSEAHFVHATMANFFKKYDKLNVSSYKYESVNNIFRVYLS